MRDSRLADLALLVLVIVVAAAMRLVFLGPDPPAFLTTDSITYALPASQLAQGNGFDLSLRRTPAYPLFLAAIWGVFGPDLHPVVYLQHLIGVITAGLAFLLGRLAFGRLVGLLGGLAVALSGPQIVYEHYLMTESLFTLLLVLALLALVAALRRDSSRLYLATGVLFGLCALTRPVGQILPLLVPLGALVAGGGRGTKAEAPSIVRRLSWRLAGRAFLLALLGLSLVVLPWMARNRLVGGELTVSSALGKTLFGRITRHDDGFRFDLPPAGPAETDERRARARSLARQAAAEDTSRGSLVHEQLMREFGYGEAQAYAVMRDAALDVILAQPGYYVLSSLGGVVELFLGDDESLREHVDRLSTPRLRREWKEAPALSDMLPDIMGTGERWRVLRPTRWAAHFYQPSNAWTAPLVGLFFLVGCVAIPLRPAWRIALPLPLTAVTVLLLSAFLDGPVIRFRYPIDPIIGIVAGAGLAAAFDLARRAVGRAPGAEPRGPGFRFQVSGFRSPASDRGPGK